MKLLMPTLVITAFALVVSAPEAFSRADDQALSPVDDATFRNIWVAGFVTADRPDFDLNGAVVRAIRSALRSQSAPRVVDVAAVRLRDDTELVRRDDYRVIVEEHGYPLVVAGAVSFNYPVGGRKTPRPGRHVDVHPTVTLRARCEIRSRA